MGGAPPTTRPWLEEVQRLRTSGARAVEPFTHDGVPYLAVPQLADDVPGQPAAMTGGDSDVDTVIYRREGGVFVEHQRLPVPGGEDAEFFAIGDRRFLATASLRSGRGPYRMDGLHSVIYELRGDRFEPFQRLPTFAAKQWRHFAIDGRHFLALAQGMALPGTDAGRNARSCIFEWAGNRFAHLQDVRSTWGYNWLFVGDVGPAPLLAYADHVEPSCLLQWTGRTFEPFQDLEGDGGRAFCSFAAAGERWLAFACLLGDSWLHGWDGRRFVRHRRLSGPGGREFEWIAERDTAGIAEGDAGVLVQINFIHGTREAPQPALQSTLHVWRGDGLEVAEQFDTSGGTDAAAFEADGLRHLAVSNSLSEALRFQTDTRIYRFASR